MIDGRASKNPADYSVILKRKRGEASMWRWEIHRAGRSSAITTSDYKFATMSSVKLAADEALRSFRNAMEEAGGHSPDCNIRLRNGKR
jgi:hypothetical protein